MDDQLYSFAFRGLLTDDALDRTPRVPRIPQSAAIDAAIAKSVALELLDEEWVARARRMATVYAAIAAFDNSAREFVAKRLLEGPPPRENWWADCVSEKIRKKAETRQEEEAKIRWHTPRGDQPLNYTEFGDLTAIIGQNWELFEPHLRNQDWVRQILSTLERSRNVIMHSGDLATADIERIGTVIRDWVKQVGSLCGLLIGIPIALLECKQAIRAPYGFNSCDCHCSGSLPYSNSAGNAYESDFCPAAGLKRERAEALSPPPMRPPGRTGRTWSTTMQFVMERILLQDLRSMALIQPERALRHSLSTSRKG